MFGNKKRSAVSGECEIDKSLAEALTALKLESFCNLSGPCGGFCFGFGHPKYAGQEQGKSEMVFELGLETESGRGEVCGGGH